MAAPPWLMAAPPWRRVATLLVAVVVLAATGAGCSDDTPTPVTTTAPSETAAVPTTPSATAVPPVAEPDTMFAVTPWFVSGEGIAPGQPRFVRGPDVAASTLDALFAGPTDDDIAAGLGTGIEPRARVLSVSVDGDTVVVDCNRAFETADTQPQVAQVVYTLTELDGIAKVKFLIDGEDNGATGVRPMGRADTRVQPVG